MDVRKCANNHCSISASKIILNQCYPVKSFDPQNISWNGTSYVIRFLCKYHFKSVSLKTNKVFTIANLTDYQKGLFF